MIKPNDLLVWLHKVSDFFKSKIYTDVDIDFMPEYYYAIWCINGKQREILFDVDDRGFAKCYKI